METHSIALVVFCEAEGVDFHDAAAGAAMALSHVISGGENGAEGYARIGTEWPVEVGFIRPIDGQKFAATVHHRVIEAGIAMRNGYLSSRVTGLAFPSEVES